jgi:hypothetical protein
MQVFQLGKADSQEGKKEANYIVVREFFITTLNGLHHAPGFVEFSSGQRFVAVAFFFCNGSDDEYS